ncbi:hypothetical protein DKX38_006895 [Salix brachista]|uniref:Leucine-rich repeat-containing N-terminal plant-type domain-containing protein n=1 Tax=Salix brachista TaxID=2182728 RepID=A0A5N5MP74_9ROSI|nr:hypothetical protein DKX38_006895 [Salix brachista]
MMMMEKMWAWMLLTTLLTSVGQWHGHCNGCLEEERNGLLSIKALIDPNNVQWKLSDWTANQEDMADCCAWYGVGCDNTTRRVVQLSLSDARDKRLGDWLLNASLFLPFEELQSLDLSANRLVGCFENQGFGEPSSKLSRLDVLDLSFNPFNDDSILSCLSGLLSLKSLDLSANRLEGSGFKALPETGAPLSNGKSLQ